MTESTACVYGLKDLPFDTIQFTPKLTPDEVIPAGTKWSGFYPIPQIGERVNIKVNKLGWGVVDSYFVENGWLGVTTKLLDAPEWHKKQHPASSDHHNTAMVMGAELR